MNPAMEKQTILVVDDTPENIDVLRGLLSTTYKVKAALNGERALKIVRAANPPHLILLDIMMPGIDGYEVCRQLKADPATQKIPVIFVTAKSEEADETRGFELGAADYITKPVSPPIVQARVKTHLALYDQNLALEKKVLQKTEELNQTRLEVIHRLGRAAEYKDNETGLHVIRMSLYSKVLAKAAGFDDRMVALIHQAAPMHDIGKIGIPDEILRKPGKLDDHEWAVIRKHPAIGAKIIGEHDSELLKLSRIVALEHHEKWNGKGYPRGIASEEIHIAARIVAIADVFDALTSDRPYKKGWPVDKTVALLQEESGEHFDPKLVPYFVEALPEIKAIMAEYSETSGHEA